MLVWAAAANINCGNDQIATTPTVVLPNATISIAPPIPVPGGFWVGFKTTAALGIPGSGISGAFYNPCQPCGPDFSNGVTVQWNPNGCFQARIF